MKLVLDVWYEAWQRCEDGRGAGGDTEELHGTDRVVRDGEDRIVRTSEHELTACDQVDRPASRLGYPPG